MIRAALIPAFVVLVLAACADSPEVDRRADTAMRASADTSELRRIYGDIRSRHDALMHHYSDRASNLPPEARQRYEEMQRMHGAMWPLHEQMMEREMHHEEMHRDTVGATWNVERLREESRQMRAMHEEMSAYMREHGHEDMAALHEEMVRRYSRAMDALEGDAP